MTKSLSDYETYKEKIAFNDGEWAGMEKVYGAWDAQIKERTEKIIKDSKNPMLYVKVLFDTLAYVSLLFVVSVLIACVLS